MRRRLSVTLASLLGCSAAPAPPAPPPPVPVVTPAPQPSTAPSATPALPTPEPPSPFHVAVRGSDPALYVLGKSTFIGRYGSATFLEVRGDAIARRDDLAAGVPSCHDDPLSRMRFPGEIFGAAPDTMWLTMHNATARTGYSTFLRWSGQKWVSMKRPEVWGSALLGAYPWRRSVVLAVTHTFAGSWFERLGGSDPEPKMAPSPENDSQCRSAIQVSSVMSLGGHLVAAGASCRGAGNGPGLLVQRWSPDAVAGTLDEVLPRSGNDSIAGASLAGASATDLYVGASISDKAGSRPFLAHFDGKTWTPVKTPLSRGIGSMARGEDGVYWVLDETPRLWTFRPDGAWDQVTLPRDATGKLLDVSRVQVTPDGTVWLTAHDALARTGPARDAFDWNDADCPPVRVARPATESCWGRIFVLLYTLTRTTPPDYDFPALREAIKGQRDLAGFRFAETEENGRRYLVGFPAEGSNHPLVDANRLARRVRDKVPGSTPVPLCGAPREIRELRIDVATGAVLK